MAEFVSDLYVAEGYATTDYVSDTYVDAGYVQGAILGEASLTVSATVSAQADKLKRSSATLSTTATLITTAQRIRSDVVSLSSSATFTTTAQKIRSGITLQASSGTLTATATRIKDAQADINTAGAVVVVAGRIRSGTWLEASSGTLTANAVRTRAASATLDINAHDSVTWADYGTWDHDPQQIWGPTVYLPDSGIQIFLDSGAIDISSAFSVSAIGGVTVNGIVLQASSGTLTATSNRLRDNDAQLSGQLTTSILGSQTHEATASLQSQGSLEVDSFVGKIGSADLSTSFTLTASPSGIFEGIVLQASSGTLVTAGNRLRDNEADLDAFNTVLSIGNKIKAEAADLTATATLTVDPIVFFTGDATLETTATLNVLGTQVHRASSTMTAFNTVLSALTIYTIDPFRVYSVDSESRTLIIEAEERKFTVKPENRLNNIEQETRGFIIKSETRILKPQTLTYIEVSGNPLDRREG